MLLAQVQEQRPFAVQGILPTLYSPGTSAYDLGFTLGWHFNDQWYLGALHRFAGQGEADIGWMGGNARVLGQEGLERVRYERDPIHSLELRWSPWEFGLFFSVGGLLIERQVDRFEYDKRLRILGDNAYQTDLKLTTEREAGGSVGAGLGFTHIYDWGLNLSGGWFVGVDNRTKTFTIETPNAESTVADSDLDELREDLRWRERMNPLGIFHLAVGWNF